MSTTHPKINISIRNSFLSSAFSPFVSDIDMTVILPNRYGVDQTQDALKTILQYRNFFPVLGEINSYSWAEIEKFKPCLNPLEGARDPVLHPFLRQTIKPEDKFTFLLRMIEADSANLLHRPLYRWKKWERHLSSCGLTVPKRFDLEILLKIVMDTFLPEHADLATETVFNFLRLVKQGTTYDKFDLNLILWAIFPNRFCFHLETNIELPAWLAQIQEAQLQWETWGLMSQRRIYLLKDTEDQMNLLQHIDNLITVFPQYSYLKDLKNICLVQDESI